MEAIPETYFLRRGQRLDLLIKDRFNPFTHLSYNVLRAIESHAVGKDQSNIRDELVSVMVSGSLRVRVWLLRIRGNQFSLHGRKIHRILYDGEVVGYVEGNRIDREKEGCCILQFLKCTNGRHAKSVLSLSER